MEKSIEREAAYEVTICGKRIQYVFLTEQEVAFIRNEKQTLLSGSLYYGLLTGYYGSDTSDKICAPIMDKLGSYFYGDPAAYEYDDIIADILKEREEDIEDDPVEKHYFTTEELNTFDVDIDHPNLACMATLIYVDPQTKETETLSELPVVLPKEDYTKLLMTYYYHRTKNLSYYAMQKYGYIDTELNQKIIEQVAINDAICDKELPYVFTIDNINEDLTAIFGEPPYHHHLEMRPYPESLTEVDIFGQDGQMGFIVVETEFLNNKVVASYENMDAKAVFSAMGVDTYRAVAERWKNLGDKSNKFDVSAVLTWLKEHEISYEVKQLEIPFDD